MAELPELDEANRLEIAKLEGVAPLDETAENVAESVAHGSGHASVRRSLYMATLSATRHNRTIQSFYARLVERRKATKKAPVTCA